MLSEAEIYIFEKIQDGGCALVCKSIKLDFFSETVWKI